MNLEESTSLVLRYGSTIGILVIAVGLLARLAGIQYDETVMTAGILTIVFTPFAGMVVSFAVLSIKKERRYALSALALIVITLLGMLIAFYLR